MLTDYHLKKYIFVILQIIFDLWATGFFVAATLFFTKNLSNSSVILEKSVFAHNLNLYRMYLKLYR